MNTQDLVKQAVSKNNLSLYMMGFDGKCVDQAFMSPGIGYPDCSTVLYDGIYRIFVSDERIKREYEDALINMVSVSDYGAYVAFLYLMSQFFYEREKLSPFVMEKEKIVESLRRKLVSNNDFHDGVMTLEGTLDKSVNERVKIWRKRLFEENGIRV